jgi:endonuclease/exonuclease/phosphatase family metal-dependent hydrolase
VQTDLTVVTFNIRSARAQDGSVHLGQIAQALAGWHPDIVLLQEVDRGRIWTGRVDMPSVLADDLHMGWTFGVNVRRSATNEYGTAILSRYPILRPRNMLLPAPPGTQQRGLLHATIDVDGMLLSVYGTHLESSSRVARLEQIRTIAPILAADLRPEIFGGDLNSTPDTRVVARTRTALADTWQAVGQGPGFTHPAEAPHIRIDYLFYRSGSGVDIQPLQAQVLGHVVSDHRPVRAVYRLSSGHGEVCVPNLSTGQRH